MSVVDRSSVGQSASEAYQGDELDQTPSDAFNQDEKVAQINENPLISGNAEDSRIVQQLMQQITCGNCIHRPIFRLFVKV